MKGTMDVGTARLRVIVSAREVRDRVAGLARELARELRDSSPRLVVIEKGGRVFASWLEKELRGCAKTPGSLHVSVRRTEGQRLVEPIVGSLDTTHFADREVVIVDDICDEGRTLEAVLDLVQQGRPRKVMTAVLVSKLERRISPVRLDHVGFTLATGWVVGCGMDLDGKLRDLEHLAILDEPAQP